MMRSLFSISIIFLMALSYVFPFSLRALDLIHHSQDFDAFQKTLTYDEVQKKITGMLQKDPEVADYYSLNSDALHLFASAEDKAANNPEFTLYFGSKVPPKKVFPKLANPYLPLKGLRIAIDPGHLGGDYAKLEAKYVQMNPNPSRNIHEPISFCEGDLNVETAKKLAQSLEALGAKVFLTRSKSGELVCKTSFEDWLKNDWDLAIQNMASWRPTNVQAQEKHWWKNEATTSEIFRLTYNFLDVERRAELINSFKPHLTVCCHYNLGLGYDSQGNCPGTDTDYALFFVPGAFEASKAKHEAFAQKSLQSPRSRYEFVRYLVSDDIERSIALAEIALKNTQKILKVPAVKDNACFGMLHKRGIYHRNLGICKLVHGPVLYGEPLLQDNYQNAKTLYYQPEQIINKMVQIYSRSIVDWATHVSEEVHTEEV